MDRAHADVGEAAFYLLAFRRGHDEDEEDAPLVGAVLVAELLDTVRAWRAANSKK